MKTKKLNKAIEIFKRENKLNNYEVSIILDSLSKKHNPFNKEKSLINLGKEICY